MMAKPKRSTNRMKGDINLYSIYGCALFVVLYLYCLLCTGVYHTAAVGNISLSLSFQKVGAAKKGIRFKKSYSLAYIIVVRSYKG
jgi:hypothetical protein